MSFTVTFIRHGESVFNRYGGIQDHVDCGLTSDGREQSKKLDMTFDLLVLSPMRRCFETLIFSNLKAYRLEYCQLCREHKTDKCDFRCGEPFEIETEEDLLERVKEFKSWLISQYNQLRQEGIKKPKIGVLTHADFFFYLSSHWDLKSQLRFGQWLKNAETKDFEIKIHRVKVKKRKIKNIEEFIEEDEIKVNETKEKRSKSLWNLFGI